MTIIVEYAWKTCTKLLLPERRPPVCQATATVVWMPAEDSGLLGFMLVEDLVGEAFE